MIELPNIESWTAPVLSRTFQEQELCDSIAYLNLVLTGMIPVPELFRLGIDSLNYTEEELRAVQRRLALAISHQRRGRQIRTTKRRHTATTVNAAA